MLRVAKSLLGIALLPTAAGAVLAAAMALGQAASQARLTLPFLLGLGSYAAFHFAVHRSTGLYVLGHELAHAFAAWMSGARVMGMEVGRRGGHVDLSHSNAWIALAPYVIPFYAVGTVLAYRTLLWWGPLARTCGSQRGADAVHWAFLLAMGAALSFHVVQTAEALLTERQPDLKLAGGVLFALPVIGLGNALALLLAMKCLFPGAVSLHRCLGAVWSWTSAFWAGLAALLMKASAAAAAG